ncbi:MAG TPA: N-acetyl-alpha-D-glucosaminyl L-malate synthase BshA [Planctomycetota bacterium]|nr:N-acetyl-alpha-D-glucosaminyl L-malate synthase BshA [Planctomycetota bacterium]
MSVGVACYPSVGGSGVVATELAVALAEKGHKLRMFTFAPPHRPAPGVCLHLVDVFAYPLLRYPPYDLALASAIVDSVEHEGPLDVLHVHYAVPHAISAYLARAMLGNGAFATITTLHGTDISIVGSDPAYATVTRFGIEQSDGVTAVSESLRRETISVLGIRRSIDVIPNFVDPEVFRPAARAAGDPVRLVHASNFREVKRPLDLIRIFALVNAAVPCRLSLLGDGPERPAALDLARDLGVHDRIDFFGPVQAPADLLARSDLFLLPSELESFGLSALEALACGVPVIASRVGGLPEVVDDGSSGYLRPVGDVEGMAAGAIELLRDPARRRAFGEIGRARAIERFSRDAVVERYVACYEAALAQRR